MTDRDREERIEALFSAIYDLSPAERNAELQSLEEADRAELEALIATHDSLTTQGEAFLQVLDTGRARSLLEQSGRAAPGTIGRYNVVRPLARGGMGIVYLAHDPRLDRLVAIKLLPSYLRADPAAVRDLAEEARIASALDDPRIETVYEIGETADGSVFIAMAYYDGDTLRERIATGSIAVSEALQLGIQLAEGIDAAHRAGIIHGDVKPENVVITKGGALKIVDFGVARVLREGLTTAELLPGTAAYMSPEQTRGERLDGRADVWSIGVVLHEMLSGRRPFQGEGETLVDAIGHAAPPDLATLRPDLSSGLVRVVARCLEKDRDRRPESAGAIAAELRAAVDHDPDDDAAEAIAPRRKLTGGRILAALGAAVLVIVTAATVLERRDHDDGTTAAGNTAPAIAVLPFEVHGEELGLWREGMVDLLSIVLAEGTELRAVDARTVLARWREAVDDRGEPDLEGALDVARGTGARYAVLGSIVSVAQGLLLGARIHSLPEGRELASFQVQGSADSLFGLVDLLAVDILSAAWQGEGLLPPQLDLTRTTTSSLPALKAFLDGERLLRRADFGGAVAAYERAVAGDSTFAFAVFHQGLAYGWLGDAARQDESYARALRHAARLPEPERLLLRAIAAGSTSDLIPAIAMLSDVTRRYPDNPAAWYFLGDRYFHDGEQVLANQEESERAFRRVVALDPAFAPAYVHLVHNAFSRRPDSARADSLLRAYRHLAPTSDSNLEQRIALDLAFGDSTRRNAAWAALDTLPLEVGRQLADLYFDHPRFWATRQAVLESVQRRQTPIDEVGYHLTTLGLLDNALSRGNLQAALALLDDPALLAGSRAVGTFRIYTTAALPSPSTLESALQPPADTFPTGLQFALLWFYSGAYAADRERWDDHAVAVERLLEERNRLLDDGDSASARFVRGMATALTGKGLWARGDPAGALPLLSDGQRLATWPVSAHRKIVNESIRWWIGELLLESGRPRDAAPYFEASWNDPLAAERLGPIYERIGDPVGARAAYALVVSAWKDADPELQPRVRAARAALARLEGSQPD